MTLRRSINILLSVACLAAIGGILFSYRDDAGGTQDVQIYREIAGKVAAYRAGGDFLESEYPPLASSMFFAIQKKADLMQAGFSHMWLVALFAIMCTAVVAASIYKRRDGALLSAGLLITTLLLGRELLFARFDILIGLLLFFVMRFHADKKYAWSYGVLAVAASLKLVPVLLLPLLILTTSTKMWKQSLIGAALGAGLSLIASLLALTPMGLIANVAHLLSYHGGRGIQLESTWSGLELLWTNVHGMKSAIGFGAMSAQNMAFGSAAALSALIAVVLGTLTIAWISRKRAATDAASFQRAFIGTIALILALSPILSPQFIVWLLPLVIAWYVERVFYERSGFVRSLPFLGLLLVIGFGTHHVFPVQYGALLDQTSLSVIATLCARNAALFASAWLLIKPLVHRSKRQKKRVNKRKTFIIGTVAFAAMLSVWAGLHRALELKIDDVRYGFEGEEMQDGELPLFVPSGPSPMRVRFQLELNAFHANVFRIKPDDCIEILLVNGAFVEDDNALFCDYGSGRGVDLSDYVEPGENSFDVVIRDDGGLGGMSMIVDRADPKLLLTDVILLIAIIGYGLLLSKLAPTASLRIAAIIFSGGAALRFLYFAVTHYNTRGHDTDAHIDYIQYVAEHFMIPPAHDGWEYHQPPLYYFISALWYAMGDAFGRAEALLIEDMQVFSLLCAIITLALGIRIAYVLFPRKEDSPKFTLLATLLSVWPSLIFVTARISNDVLYQPLIFGVMLSLIQWWKHGRMRDWYACCILFSLAFITKISIAALAPILFICFVFKRGIPWKNKLLHAVLSGLCIMVMTLWLPAYRYIAESNSTRSLTLGNDGMHSGLQTENTAANWLTFNPIEILKVPYNNPWNDENRRKQFPEYVYRSAFFGEFGFDDLFKNLSAAMLLLGYVAMLFALIGIIKEILRNTRATIPLLGSLVLLFASLITYRWNFPYTSNQDFRFITAALIPLTYYAIVGTDIAGTYARWLRASLWILGIFCTAFIVLLYATGG